MSSALLPGRWKLWLPLLCVAGYLALFGDKTPSNTAATSVVASRSISAPATSPTNLIVATRARAPSREAIEALLPREELMSAVGEPAVDLFARAGWSAAPPSLAPATTPVPAPPQPPAVPAPPPPSPAYRVLGKKWEGDVWEVYLGRDDVSFVVRTGDTLEGQWRVDKIDPPTMVVSHLSSGQTHNLAIGESR